MFLYRDPSFRYVHAVQGALATRKQAATLTRQRTVKSQSLASQKLSAEWALRLTPAKRLNSALFVIAEHRILKQNVCQAAQSLRRSAVIRAYTRLPSFAGLQALAY